MNKEERLKVFYQIHDLAQNPETFEEGKKMLEKLYEDGEINELQYKFLTVELNFDPELRKEVKEKVRYYQTTSRV